MELLRTEATKGFEVLFLIADLEVQYCLVNEKILPILALGHGIAFRRPEASETLARGFF